MKKQVPSESKKVARYVEGVGRRKTAVARVRLIQGEGGVTVNRKSLAHHFPLPRHQHVVMSPLEALKLADKFGVTISVKGGGVNAQAEAVRHGLARALTLMNAEFKGRLRQLGYLTRDPRMVERKKYGLKKARRAPQWAKR